MNRDRILARRLKRGELARPGSYWFSFVSFSLTVHLLLYAGLSGAAEDFIRNLPKPVPPKPPILYVELLFNAPGGIKGVQAATRPAALSNVPAGSRKPGKAAARPDTKDTEQATPTAKDKDAPPPTPTATPVRPLNPGVIKHAPRNERKSAATKPQPAKPVELPDTHAENTMPVPDTDGLVKADVKYRRFFEPSDDAVLMISGTEITEVPRTQPIYTKTVGKLAPKDKWVEPDFPAPAPELAPEPVTDVAEPDGFDNDRAEPVYPINELMPFSGVYALPGALAMMAEDTLAAQPGTSGAPPVMAVPDRESGRPGPLVMDYPQHQADRESAGHKQAAGLSAFMLADSGVIPFVSAVQVKAAPQPLDTRSINVKPKNVDKPANIPEPEKVSAPKPLVIEVALQESPSPPSVRITSPEAGDTARGLIDVAGVVTGDGVGSVLLWLGERRMELLIKDGSFGREVALERGRNAISVMCTDSGGRVSRDRVVVYYNPDAAGNAVSMSSPADGEVLDALVAKEAVLAGEVRGTGIDTVRLFYNNRILDVPVKDGKFSRKFSLEAEDNTVFAEATGRDGVTSRSEEVSFRVVNLLPKELTVRVDTELGQSVQVVTKWKPHPTQGARLKPEGEFTKSMIDTGEIAAVEVTPPGVYTVGLMYSLPPGEKREATFTVTLHGYDERRKQTRVIGPVTLSGKGYLPAVRVLMPEDLFWEDDHRFSGIVESSSGAMKFKNPEGISWTEED